MKKEKIVRCVNIDWLEVYVLEPNDRYPMDADYFRRKGYLVNEREYGTRVYTQMFTIVNSNGDPLIEIRREPASGASDFHGLVPQSSHIRIPNWRLYGDNPIGFLSDFLLQNDYIFKRIYRIDICYDFEKFDSGDTPARFAQRYIERRYRKINQCLLRNVGEDRWADFAWQSLSWGSKSSMVTTKLYNKTLELKQGKTDKPWIKTCWMVHGLIDNPVSMTKLDGLGNLYTPEIWRIEFSMMSPADGYIAIEFNHASKPYKQTIPHRLPMYDTKEKLWQRFQDLAYNYFHFKVKVKKKRYQGAAQFALEKVHSHNDDEWQRKDRCPDKVLFKWDADHVFYKLSAAPGNSHKNNSEERLRKLLLEYRLSHADPRTIQACDLLIDNIERVNALRFVPMGDPKERLAIQRALAAKIGGDPRDIVTILSEMTAILNEVELF